MPDSIPGLRGRLLALAAIVLLALNLRTAVASLSPIIGVVADDLGFDSLGIGLLGALPPIAFAVAGIVAPRVAKRIGIEASLALACAAMVVGPLIRSIAPGFLVLLLGGVVALSGMGFGNILLPAAIKRYFPDRIGVLTSLYSTLIALSIAIPPLVAAPIAEVGTWRAAAATWALLAAAAAVPWLVLWARARRTTGSDVPAPAPVATRLHRSRVALAITLAFVVSALSTYAMLAWLPELLIDATGMSRSQAGVMLFLYGIAGLVPSFLVPLLAVRLRSVTPLLIAGVSAFSIGYLGLLLAPHVLTALWVTAASIGGLLFPLCLVLINLRSITAATSAAVSGFVQAFGYGAAAIGPLLLGVLHDLSGGWTVPLLFLLGSALAALPAIGPLRRGTTVDAELADRD